MKRHQVHIKSFLCATLVVVHQFCGAAVGLLEMPATPDAGPVTVFYPASGEPKTVVRGAFSLEVAERAPPMPGNGRLVVISHGSTASPWVYSDLAQTLVNAGFVVAMPEHEGDNFKDGSEPGPPSWKKRPLEVSRAIDTLAKDPWFATHVDFKQVGVYGMSAGGHTALSMAGGRWSPAEFRRHCEAHIREDFQTCVGLITQLTGGWLDGLKMRVATWVIRQKFSDENWYAHADPRVTAVVAGVPLSADFDLTTLSAPQVPLGIIVAKRDKWLIPVFHSDRLLRACTSCEVVMSLDSGGHGALLSPLPPHRSGVLAALIDDEPDFDRAKVVPDMNRKIAGFFQRHLKAH
jgi:predicted dienelactone hydrolase